MFYIYFPSCIYHVSSCKYKYDLKKKKDNKFNFASSSSYGEMCPVGGALYLALIICCNYALVNTASVQFPIVDLQPTACEQGGSYCQVSNGQGVKTFYCHD